MRSTIIAGLTGMTALGCTFDGSQPLAGDAQPVTDGPRVANDGAPLDAPLAFGPWTNITLLNVAVGEAGDFDDPMLTDDFELFFAAPGVGFGQDIYSAKPDGAGGYNAPQAITEVNTANRSETTLWVSGDALMLMFGRQTSDTGAVQLDLFLATRANRNAPFEDLQRIPEASPGLINSDAEEGLGALSQDQLTLYFTSNRGVPTGPPGPFNLYRATRASAQTPFDTVTILPMSLPTRDELSPKLSPDERTLYFAVRDPASEVTAEFETFFASIGPSNDFENPARLDDIDGAISDLDFAPHSNNLTAVFASNRTGGDMAIYRTERTAR